MGKGFVSIRLDEELIQELDEFAEATGNTRSALIERFVRNGLADGQQFLKQFESPVLRKAWGVLTSRAFLRALATVAGEEITPDMSEGAAKGQRLVKAARKTRKGAADGAEPKGA